MADTCCDWGSRDPLFVTLETGCIWNDLAVARGFSEIRSTCISTSRTHSTLSLSTEAFQKAVQHHPPQPLNRVSVINSRGNASTKTIQLVYQPHATETIQMVVQLKRDSTYQRHPSALNRDYSDSRPTYTATSCALQLWAV